MPSKADVFSVIDNFNGSIHDDLTDDEFMELARDMLEDLKYEIDRLEDAIAHPY